MSRNENGREKNNLKITRSKLSKSWGVINGVYLFKFETLTDENRYIIKKPIKCPTMFANYFEKD